jgi:hypothetical protein
MKYLFRPPRPSMRLSHRVFLSRAIVDRALDSVKDGGGERCALRFGGGAANRGCFMVSAFAKKLP